MCGCSSFYCQNQNYCLGVDVDVVAGGLRIG
jgi:hypothetical protein